jgi:hypothetical protein
MQPPSASANNTSPKTNFILKFKRFRNMNASPNDSLEAILNIAFWLKIQSALYGLRPASKAGVKSKPEDYHISRIWFGRSTPKLAKRHS